MYNWKVTQSHCQSTEYVQLPSK